MLSEHYENTILGFNYLSLLKGLISLHDNSSTLIIQDEEVSFNNKWCRQIGYLERETLKLLGQQYSIEPLINIDNYLKEQNTVLNLNETMIELCSSPYANLKELARKLPESFASFYREKFETIESDYFDVQFINFLDTLSLKGLNHYGSQEFSKIFNDEVPELVSHGMKSFSHYLESNTMVSKQLHYLLQVMFQSVFSPGKDNFESNYLYISAISPRYEIDYLSLQDDLLYEYRNAGGDIKQTKVEEWGVVDNRLEYILLNSIDGIIHLGNFYYFDYVRDGFPFDHLYDAVSYRSINIECQLDHDYIDLFKNKRIVFGRDSRIGTDFPHWEMQFNASGKLVASYSYADYEGTKPSFYYPHALEDLFNSLIKLLPGLAKADFLSRVKLSQGDDIWHEYPAARKQQLRPFSKFKTQDFYQSSKKKKVSGMIHCGPLRSKSLGLYSYILDVFPLSAR